MAKKTIWVLTSDQNEYDDRGNYFIAAFAEAPSVGALAEAMRGCMNGTDVMEAVALLEHIRAGGGRRGDEHTWYFLREEPLR